MLKMGSKDYRFSLKPVKTPFWAIYPRSRVYGSEGPKKGSFWTPFWTPFLTPSERLDPLNRHQIEHIWLKRGSKKGSKKGSFWAQNRPF